MSMTPEEQTFLINLRERSKPGSDQPPTLEEQKRAIIILRGNRKLAVEAAASGASRSRAKKSPPTAAEVGNALADLDMM
jgi:hypothetical protein